ncbi:DUF6603 domain-containing protein [Kitasatospora sp. NPDC090091]|uniref:DUF6603 domain-containing protein n=1 Tax=Kitasatospora sp. NPDC090091 TaxID=3364081 RepID=UPI0038268F8E
MTDSVVELATGLRQALTDVFGTLAGLATDEQRREALKTALGDVTPGALLGRLTALGADQAGQLLPTLVTIVARAVLEAAPDWHLEIPGALRVDATHVEVLAPALPSELLFGLRVGAVPITTGVEVHGGIDLALTVPADVTKAALVVTIGGLRLRPPGDALLALLVPGGGPLFEGDVTARADARGVSFDGGGRSGVSLPLKTVPPMLKAPALYLAPRDAAIRLTLSFGASLLGLADATVEGVGAEVAVSGTGVTATPVPADGIGLRLALGPAKGAGYLKHDGDRYAGAMSLGLGVVDVKAFGVLHTSPFSLLAVLSAEFNPPVELGLAFTLNAVGGIVGVGSGGGDEAELVGRAGAGEGEWRPDGVEVVAELVAVDGDGEALH